MTDEEVITALRQGGKAATAALDFVFDRYRERTVAYLVSKEIDGRQFDGPAVAYDLFVEALLALRDNVRSGRLQALHSGTLATYLTTICRYKYYALARKQNPQPPPPLALAEDDVDEALILSLRRFVREMEEKCRELLTYFYFDKLPMKEVIRLTHHTYNSVAAANVANQRCRAALRRRVQAYLQTQA